MKYICFSVQVNEPYVGGMAVVAADDVESAERTFRECDEFWGDKKLLVEKMEGVSSDHKGLIMSRIYEA